MSEQYPLSGVKRVIRPDGTVNRVEWHDEPITPDEKQAFAQYNDLSPLELMRRLRTAEWNAAERRRTADTWKAAAQRLEGELAHARRQLATYAPDGYAVPKVVAELVAYAESHGWRSLLQWAEPEDGTALLNVQVGRTADDDRRGPHWLYRLTWACEPDAARRSRSGLAQTPDRPQWHDAPSVRKIREVIYANPAPDAVTVHKGPISREEFHKIPGARALRFSHDWMNLRYTEWIEDAPGWGWVLMSDYGNPDDHCVVSRADSRAMAADHLTAFLAPNRSYGGGNLTVDEWEIAP